MEKQDKRTDERWLRAMVQRILSRGPSTISYTSSKGAKNLSNKERYMRKRRRKIARASRRGEYAHRRIL